MSDLKVLTGNTIQIYERVGDEIHKLDCVKEMRIHGIPDALLGVELTMGDGQVCNAIVERFVDDNGIIVIWCRK
jgi:hypothetical protein